MKYTVDYDKKADKQLRKMDTSESEKIYDWIDENLEGCENPRAYGKPLKGNRKGYWRYRVGDYRIIADIQDNKVLILVTEVGHRREIYKEVQ